MDVMKTDKAGREERCHDKVTVEQRPKENEGQERAGYDPGLSGPVLLLPQHFNVKNEVM